ncbi:MAG: hypothetical protein KDC66_12570 [Phaeodactylibacter sp.]|nr:hypothetical protein [Phaeodactylibacter sp.]MCB9275173.1 hypothetical protein [Lewinellaceae bacterium]
MKNAWKAAMIVLSIFLLASCRAWDCGCPMSQSPVEQPEGQVAAVAGRNTACVPTGYGLEPAVRPNVN